MLPDLNPRQLRASTCIYCIHPRLAGSLAQLKPKMHIVLMHILFKICRRGRWRCCFVPKPYGVGVVFLPGCAAKDLLIDHVVQEKVFAWQRKSQDLRRERQYERLRGIHSAFPLVISLAKRMKTSFAKRASAIKFRTAADFHFTIRSDFLRRRCLKAGLVAGTSHMIRRTIPYRIVHTWKKPNINV